MIKATLPRQVYEKYCEIDLDALFHNLKCIQGQTSAEVMGIVKANAYGHNISLIAPALWEWGVRRFGVATLAEALVLKGILPQGKILILGAQLPEQMALAIQEGFEFILHSLEDIERIETLAHPLQKARVHIKFDTGMGRVGILPSELQSLLFRLSQMECVEVIGICSHLATSDNPHCPHTQAQITAFEQLHQKLSVVFPGAVFHLANSDGILHYPDAHYDVVRPGLALYGYSSKKEHALRPVLSLRARITQVKTLPEAHGIGYGRSVVTSGAMRVGVLPLGYADGLIRSLSNRLEVLIRGKRIPLVGRISMDQSVVDLSSIPEVQAGEWVTLIGREGSEQISAQDWSDKIETISYEVLTGLGARIPRYAAGSLTLRN